MFIYIFKTTYLLKPLRKFILYLLYIFFVDDTDTGKVVALGTGAACLRMPYSSTNGRVLHDSYAIQSPGVLSSSKNLKAFISE